MNLPEYPGIRIRKTQNGKYEVFDVLRQRYIALTPEEWVRQHFVHYLTEHLGYPAALMANEVELTVGEKRLRCDSVLYSSSRLPLMIMEYKAESVPLTGKVVNQILSYNTLLHAPYLVISNGQEHLCLHFSHERYEWETLAFIPTYENLIYDCSCK